MRGRPNFGLPEVSKTRDKTEALQPHIVWLLVAQCAQTAGSACLFFSAVNDGDYSFRWNSLGRLWLYLFVPIPFLAPIVAAICNRWPARAVLLSCGVANIAILAAFGSSFP